MRGVADVRAGRLGGAGRALIRLGLLAALLAAASAAARAPSDDGDAGGLSVAGRLAHEPEPIPPAVIAAPTASDARLCPLQTTREACESLPSCDWSPGGSAAPSGGVVGPVCFIDPSSQDRPYYLGEGGPGGGGVAVRFTLDGISAAEGFDANLFISDFSQAQLVERPYAVLSASEGMTAVTLAANSSDFTLDTLFTFTVCLNSTPCPGWGRGCAACRHEVVRREPPRAIDHEGRLVEHDFVPPKLRLEAPGFAPVPTGWSSAVLERVEADLSVLEDRSRWQAVCSLVGMDPTNPLNLSLCGAGALEPDPCEWMEPAPSGPTRLSLAIGRELVGGWKQGRYELRCRAWDDALRPPVHYNLAPEWSAGFLVGPGGAGGPAAAPSLAPSRGPAVPTYVPRCGDRRCDEGESFCCEDCGCPARYRCCQNQCSDPRCGDGVCDICEDQATCCPDCGCDMGSVCRQDGCIEVGCGDGACGRGEDQSGCCQDCGCPVGQVCVDGACAGPGPGPGGPVRRTAVAVMLSALAAVGALLALRWARHRPAKPPEQ